MSKLIYLASPYSHKDIWVEKLRALLVTIVGSKLVEQGHHIFGPITESSAYGHVGDLSGGWDYWKKHDYLMISLCKELWVLELKGWKESEGVQAEIKYAKRKGIPIKYIKLEEVIPNIDKVI